MPVGRRMKPYWGVVVVVRWYRWPAVRRRGCRRGRCGILLVNNALVGLRKKEKRRTWGSRRRHVSSPCPISAPSLPCLSLPGAVRLVPASWSGLVGFVYHFYNLRKLVSELIIKKQKKTYTKGPNNALSVVLALLMLLWGHSLFVDKNIRKVREKKE